MTTTTAFLAQIKAVKSWEVYHVDVGDLVKDGYQFQVVGKEPNSICMVNLLDENGEPTDVTYQPITGTLVIQVSDANTLTIHFMFEEGRKTRAFFLRFFFFCEDPTVFRYKIVDLPEGFDLGLQSPCCTPIDYLYPSDSDIQVAQLDAQTDTVKKISSRVLFSTNGGFGENKGGGGPHV